MKFSHQRALIKEILKGRSDHPTADMVYAAARLREPSISLGTVYRNLKTLSENGEIDTLETVDKKLHYDGNVNKHGHFICAQCYKIYDIWSKPEIPEELKVLGFTVMEAKSVYYGFCDKCKEKIAENAKK